MDAGGLGAGALGAGATQQVFTALAARETPVPTAKALAASPDAVKAARDFEAVFLSQMLSPMFSGIATDGPFGGGSGERIFRSLEVDEFGKVLAASGGIGVADAVLREIIRMQEAQTP